MCNWPPAIALRGQISEHGRYRPNSWFSANIVDSVSQIPVYRFVKIGVTLFALCPSVPDTKARIIKRGTDRKLEMIKIPLRASKVPATTHICF